MPGSCFGWNCPEADAEPTLGPASMFGDTVIRQLIRRGVYRAAPASSRRQQRGQFGRHAQHWVVAAVELGPFGAEPLGGASLVSLARVRRRATPDDARQPLPG